MKPERMVLELSLAGAGLEATEQRRLSSREMQRTATNSCSVADGSLDLRGTIFLQAVVGIEPYNQTLQLFSSR